MLGASKGACEKRRMAEVSDNPPLDELYALILVDASFIQRWQHFSYPVLSLTRGPTLANMSNTYPPTSSTDAAYSKANRIHTWAYVSMRGTHILALLAASSATDGTLDSLWSHCLRYTLTRCRCGDV